MHLNYRGSIGFGAADLKSLPGRIGAQDVADCLLLTELLLTWVEPGGPEEGGPEEGRGGLGERLRVVDRARVAVVGGSHGGFLGAHLSAQHPHLFKARRRPASAVESERGKL